MKQENYAFMTQYESNMQTASTVGYSRNIPRKEIKKIVEVYKEETGNEYSENAYCAGCLVNLLIGIKELYDTHNPAVEENYSIKENHSTEDNHEYEKNEDNKVRRLRKEKNDPGLDK